MRLCTQFGSRAKLSRAGDTTKQVGITAFWSAVRGGLKPPPRGRVGGGPGWLGTHWREGGGGGAARVRPDRAEVLSKRGAAQRCPWALHSPQAFLGWVLSPAGTSEGGGSSHLALLGTTSEPSALESLILGNRVAPTHLQGLPWFSHTAFLIGN